MSRSPCPCHETTRPDSSYRTSRLPVPAGGWQPHRLLQPNQPEVFHNTTASGNHRVHGQEDLPGPGNPATIGWRHKAGLSENIETEVGHWVVDDMRSEKETKSAKAEGAALGCLAGWGVSGCLIPVGIILCFTGIGAIIGVPLILVGLFAMIIGPLMGLGELKGECPWCGTKVTSPTASQGIDCPACKKRIVIKDKRFVRIE